MTPRRSHDTVVDCLIVETACHWLGVAVNPITGGKTARVYVNKGEMLLTLRLRRLSAAHLKELMWH